MHFFIFLSVGLVIKQTCSLPRRELSDNAEIKQQTIYETNKDLHLEGGDIIKTKSKSTILSELYLWETPVPYMLDVGLDVNAKGVILKAFDQFTVKSCIDFKLRDTEQNYLSFEKDSGCFSYVGNNRHGGQIVSIGEFCDHVFIVEHEILHALGFWHEQSRYDRDEYVTILWENIEEGQELNFEKTLKNETTSHGTPYDYYSVMHYGPYTFSNGNGTTIITKLPQFQNIIGQTLDMSHFDVVELNKLYKCTSSVGLLAKCSFENLTDCKMSQCSRGNTTWSSETFVPGGPLSGHTDLEVSAAAPTNESSTSSSHNSTGADTFMHFNMANAQEGDRAKMATRRLTLRRNCSVQCLQFYYYHYGYGSDQLNIWIREFDNKYDTGTRKLMWQISGKPADYWRLQHVPLNATKTFLVEFEGQRGQGNSSAGFSVDDMNLSETECPHQTWQIRNVEQLSASDSALHSPRYFSPSGYGYQIITYLTPSYTEVYVRLVSGQNDDRLQWPCPWHQITLAMLDQNPDIQERMSRQFSFTTNPTSPHNYLWDNPRTAGTLFNDSNGESYYVNKGYGFSRFMSLEGMKNQGFIKGGYIFFLVSMQDISELHLNNSLACNTVLPPQNFTSDLVDDGPCIPPPKVTEAPPQPKSSTMVTEAQTVSSSSIMGSSSQMVVLMIWALLWSM
ncbi:hypothetical protein GJAV_G00005590 [Gymnothorax javanicus]|nr:hypothetical protein GJAV_G00005590 [Gymnothorax javanicus]